VTLVLRDKKNWHPEGNVHDDSGFFVSFRFRVKSLHETEKERQTDKQMNGQTGRTLNMAYQDGRKIKYMYMQRKSDVIEAYAA